MSWLTLVIQFRVRVRFGKRGY